MHIAYRTDFDKTKYMSFLIKDNELLGKYNEICDNDISILNINVTDYCYII